MDTMIKYLLDFGLSDKEAKTYILLSKIGLAKASEIARSLQFNRLQAYRVLKKLSDRGLIEVSMERPRRYIPLPLEQSLDLLTQEAKSRIQELEERKPLLLKEWAKIPIKRLEEPLTKFRIIQGRKNIYKFRSRLFESAEKEIYTMTTRNGLLRSVKYGTDDILEECTRRGVIVRRISEIDEKNIGAAKRFLEFCEIRHVPVNNIARLSIVDNKDVLIYSTVDDGVKLKADKDVCLWTNNSGFVYMMGRFYNTVWDAAVIGHDRIKEIETGKQISTPYNIVLASLTTYLLKFMKETQEEKTLRRIMNKVAKQSVDHLFEELGWKEILSNFNYSLQRIAHLYDLAGSQTNIEPSGDGTYNFIVRNCPIRDFLPDFPEICEMERDFLQMFFSRYGSVEIKTPYCLSKGDKYCKLIIQMGE